MKVIFYWFERIIISNITFFFVILLFFLYALPRIQPKLLAVSRTVCSSGCQFTTIQSAINAALSGDTIRVGSGTYGAMTVNKQVIIESEDFNRANPKMNPIKINGAVTVSGSWAWDQGPTIRGFAINAPDAIIGNAPYSIEYNYVTAGADGVSFEAGGGGIVRGNYIENTGDDCIDVDNQTKNILIEDNIMLNCGQDGIEIRQQNDSIPSRVTLTFRNNRVEGSGEDGMQIMDYNNFSNRHYVVERNLFNANGKAAIGIMSADVTNENYSAAAMPEPLYVVNNTIVNNDAGISGGANLIAINNIFMAQIIFDIKNVNGKSKLLNNLFGTAVKQQGTNNLDATSTKIGNPLLDSNYIPQVSSPAINAGLATYQHTYTNGSQNITDTVVDIPAGQYVGSAPDLGWKESSVSGGGTPTITPITSPSLTPTLPQTTLTISPSPSIFVTPGPLVAFPGAEGYGAKALGGRGGKVIQVTNLNDSGTGSLRACVTATGPRTCVFTIGGTITFSSSLDISNPYLTIAGQTAPGGGIMLRTSASNNKGLVVVRPTANNVIIRYIRIRPGPGGTDGDTLDAITINSNDVILDHVSASWGVDETVNTWYPTAQNISIQWSIISEGLSNSIHPQGEHSKGYLMGEFNKNISAHHLLFAHNMDRHPEMKGDPAGILEAINNVVYNWGWRTLLVSDNNGIARVSIIGNYFKSGPNSPTKHEIEYYNSSGQGVKMYVKGNIGPNRVADSNQAMTRTNGGEWSVVSPSTADSNLVTTSFGTAPIPVTITSAEQAYAAVLTDAGANKRLDCQGNWVNNRDTVDTRVVNDVKNKTGRIINHPNDVGGWPALSAGTPCPDTDADGISDAWEQTNFGSLTVGSTTNSASDYDRDGYTDLEEFLNGTNPKGSVNPSVSPQPFCTSKQNGDADCVNGIKLADFEIWRKEFYRQCSNSNLSACAPDDDNNGILMDANFNFTGSIHPSQDTKVDTVDFEIWRKNFF